MCIFGSSGSGKSYFVKLLVIKNYFNGINQFIVDPEGEYSNLVKKLSGKVLDFKNNEENFFNILEIRKEDLEKNNFLENKVNDTSLFILELIGEENKDFYLDKIKKYLYKTYEKNNITNDINSVFKKISNSNKIFLRKEVLDSESFPTVIDFYNNIYDNDLKKLIKENIINKFNIFCGHTNINLKAGLTSINIKNLDIKDSVVILRYFYNLLFNVKRFDVNTIIYFDEIWKYVNSNLLNLSNEIFSLFKTIRKKNAGIVTITQDISDFFNYQNGNFGKTILNNSLFKIIFKMEYSDTKILNNLNLYDEDVLSKLSTLDKGNMYISFNYNNSFLNIRGNEIERELLKEE